ncbi:hypothetical protein SEUCBS139899_008845 [Sporothrix eucalyptigena]|uniref:Esterase n=1 Tax=Sporothrix eucalyptigena TaxID=1812306 RepID=A0ABP0CEY7_9PEZI
MPDAHPKIPATPADFERMNGEWIEPYNPETAPAGLQYALYDTKARGPGTQGNYWYALPDGYEDDANKSKTYPTLIWLHGGTAQGSQGAPAVDLYRTAMAAGLMPPTIIILPQALPVGWYINSIDGKFPIEDIMIYDLIPHLDATFRTNGVRGLEGFSMGGYGAAHLGLKFSELFAGVSSIGPAILPSLANEPRERVWDTFRGDQSYYDQNHPTFLLKEKADVLRNSGLRLRLLSGGDDTRLAEAIEVLSKLMDEVGVQHYRRDIAGAGHDFELILNGLGSDAAGFWKDAFSR